MPSYRNFESILSGRKTLSALRLFLLDQITGGIYLYDRKRSKLLFHNKEFEDLTGVSEIEFKQRNLQPFLDLLIPADIEMITTRAYPRIREILSRKGESDYSLLKYSMNYRIKIAPGKFKHLFHQSTILKIDSSLEPEVLLAHISDISEYKKDTAMLLVVTGFESARKKWKKLFEEKFVHYPAGLSLRENSVMNQILSGQSQKEIAKKLHISYFTVRAHCRHILEKTGCRSIKDLKQKSLEEGWS